MTRFLRLSAKRMALLASGKNLSRIKRPFCETVKMVFWDTSCLLSCSCEHAQFIVDTLHDPRPVFQLASSRLVPFQKNTSSLEVSRTMAYGLPVALPEPTMFVVCQPLLPKYRSTILPPVSR